MVAPPSAMAVLKNLEALYSNVRHSSFSRIAIGRSCASGFQDIDPAVQVLYIPSEVAVGKADRNDRTFGLEPFDWTTAIVRGVAFSEQAARLERYCGGRRSQHYRPPLKHALPPAAVDHSPRMPLRNRTFQSGAADPRHVFWGARRACLRSSPRQPKSLRCGKRLRAVADGGERHGYPAARRRFPAERHGVAGLCAEVPHRLRARRRAGLSGSSQPPFRLDPPAEIPGGLASERKDCCSRGTLMRARIELRERPLLHPPGSRTNNKRAAK